MKNKIAWQLWVMLGLCALASCKEEDAVKINDGSDQAINSWIYKTLNEVYYWTDDLPANVDKNQNPADFFHGLLVPQDRFSAIVPNYDDLASALNGVYREAGYEMGLFYKDAGRVEVEGLVFYVKKDSPAEMAGLRRGDIIDKINGSTINNDNYQSLLGDISSNHTLTFSRYNVETESLELQPQVSLDVVELSENPSFLDTVYNIAGHNIGYYVYNFFSPGVNSTEYDSQMDNVFGNFKAEGITDMVLDLRYNGGGAISSATNLASLLGRNIGPDKVFYKNEWNDFYQSNVSEGNKITKFLDKSENIGNRLVSGKLYVLTGTKTASASELIINGLKPYMEVYTIGDTTVGKNVGSIPIQDENNLGNHYGMLPIAFKIFNSNGNSDYSDGFPPDFLLNELALPIKQLGDTEETLLAEAIDLITNGGNNAGRVSASSKETKVALSSSLDKKIRSNKLILN